MVEDQADAESVLLDAGRMIEKCSVEDESIMDAVDVGSLFVGFEGEMTSKGNVEVCKARPEIDGSGDAKEVVACTVECTVCSAVNLSFELTFIIESLVGWLILCKEDVQIEDAKSGTLRAYEGNSLEVVFAIDSNMTEDGKKMEGVSVVIDSV